MVEKVKQQFRKLLHLDDTPIGLRSLLRWGLYRLFPIDRTPHGHGFPLCLAVPAEHNRASLRLAGPQSLDLRPSIGELFLVGFKALWNEAHDPAARLAATDLDELHGPIKTLSHPVCLGNDHYWDHRIRDQLFFSKLPYYPVPTSTGHQTAVVTRVEAFTTVRRVDRQIGLFRRVLDGANETGSPIVTP